MQQLEDIVAVEKGINLKKLYLNYNILTFFLNYNI